MKAVAVWPKRHRVGVEERAAPALVSPTSVRLRMLDVGICGTDTERPWSASRFCERATNGGIKNVIAVEESE